MARGYFTLAAALLSTAIFAEFAGAQSRGTSGGSTIGGTTGGFGGSSMGGSTSGRGSTSSGTFGARSLGGASGVPSANRSFRGTQPGQGVDATAGQITGSERFLRQNRQAGDFVGGDSRDAVNLFSQSGGRIGQSGMTGLRTGQGNNSNRGNRQSEGGYGYQEGGGLYGRSGQRMLRPTLRVEFTHTAPPVSTLHATLTKRLNRSSASAPGAGPLEVSIEERTAVLRGAVATAHDRDLAERLALLEPGIASVRNELTIAPSKAPPAAAAAGDLPPPANPP